MTSRYVQLLTLLFAFASTSAHAQTWGPPGGLLRISQEVAAPLARAQVARLRQDWDQALAEIQEARDVPSKTAADERVINKMFYGVIKSRAIADRIAWEQAPGATRPVLFTRGHS